MKDSKTIVAINKDPVSSAWSHDAIGYACRTTMLALLCWLTIYSHHCYNRVVAFPFYVVSFLNLLCGGEGMQHNCMACIRDSLRLGRGHRGPCCMVERCSCFCWILCAEHAHAVMTRPSSVQDAPIFQVADYGLVAVTPSNM